ncbi:hypothetical protein BH09PSE6_BH09PSE6_04840 [soil metagenome]
MKVKLTEQERSAIAELCSAGNVHRGNKRYVDAVAMYWKAWAVLPEPKYETRTATWILGAIGDVHFMAGEYSAGRDALLRAMRCPGGINNALLQLRLGQCLYELGAKEEAGQAFVAAYAAGGAERFAQADPKYLALLTPEAAAPGSKRTASQRSWAFWKRA